MWNAQMHVGGKKSGEFLTPKSDQKGEHPAISSFQHTISVSRTDGVVGRLLPLVPRVQVSEGELYLEIAPLLSPRI